MYRARVVDGRVYWTCAVKHKERYKRYLESDTARALGNERAKRYQSTPKGREALNRAYYTRYKKNLALRIERKTKEIERYEEEIASRVRKILGYQSQPNRDSP